MRKNHSCKSIYNSIQLTSVWFIWNHAKNNSNFKKHSIWFEEAQTVWTDALSVEFFDSQNKGEDRFIRIGHCTSHRLLLVVFCEKDEGNTIRIISARRATPKERKQYEEGI